MLINIRSTKRYKQVTYSARRPLTLLRVVLGTITSPAASGETDSFVTAFLLLLATALVALVRPRVLTVSSLAVVGADGTGTPPPDEPTALSTAGE